MTKTPEGRLKSVLKEMLNERGAFWSVIPEGAYAKTGDPDMIICYRGRFIGVEAKARSSQRHWQKLRQSQIQEAGGIYIKPRSVKEVLDILDQIDSELDGQE